MPSKALHGGCAKHGGELTMWAGNKKESIARMMKDTPLVSGPQTTSHVRINNNKNPRVGCDETGRQQAGPLFLSARLVGYWRRGAGVSTCGTSKGQGPAAFCAFEPLKRQPPCVLWLTQIILLTFQRPAFFSWTPRLGMQILPLKHACVVDGGSEMYALGSENGVRRAARPEPRSGKRPLSHSGARFYVTDRRNERITESKKRTAERHRPDASPFGIINQHPMLLHTLHTAANPLPLFDSRSLLHNKPRPLLLPIGLGLPP